MEYHSLVQAARVIVSRNGVVLIVRWVWKWKVRKREREGGRKAGTICPSLDQRLSYQQKHTRQRLVRRRFNGSHNTLIFICEYCHRLYYCMHYWTSLYSCLPPARAVMSNEMEEDRMVVVKDWAGRAVVCSTWKGSHFHRCRRCQR